MNNLRESKQKLEKNITDCTRKLKTLKEKLREVNQKIEEEERKERIAKNEKIISSLESKLGEIDENKLNELLQKISKVE